MFAGSIWVTPFATSATMEFVWPVLSGLGNQPEIIALAHQASDLSQVGIIDGVDVFPTLTDDGRVQHHVALVQGNEPVGDFLQRCLLAAPTTTHVEGDMSFGDTDAQLSSNACFPFAAQRLRACSPWSHWSLSAIQSSAP